MLHLEDQPGTLPPDAPLDERQYKISVYSSDNRIAFGKYKSYLTFDDVRILTGLSKKELKKKLKEKQIVAMYDEDAVRQAFDEDIC